MLYRMECLIGMSIKATDGEVGKVIDIYFDDRRWTARYLVVEAGSWLKARKLLVSPIAVRSINWEERRIQINLSCQQLHDSPPIDLDQPVSRQQELQLFAYYGYPDYLGGEQLWGATPYPLVPAARRAGARPVAAPAPATADDPRLGSMREVNGYSMQAVDAAIGHLEEFLIDNGSWAMRYVVVTTHQWWSGRRVVIPPQWIRQMDWQQKLVLLEVPRDAVQNAPEFDPAPGHARPYETNLYKHYQGAEYPLRPSFNERPAPFEQRLPAAASSASASSWR